MISEMGEQECRELLTTTTVGRLGFLVEDRVSIFPLNYVVSGEHVLVRTAADGVLLPLAEERAHVAFEVDHHDDLGGTGWSVLIHGTLSPALGGAAHGRITPWAGEDRGVPLAIDIETITGRRVRRDRR